MSLVESWKSATPQFLAGLRIVSAATFMLAGTSKLFAFPVGMPPDNATATPFTQVWVGGVLEVFGGLFVLIGLFTRPMAFVLSGMMAVAYWQFHFKPDNPWPTVNGGVAAVMYCFVFLFLSSAGAGAWSIDSLRALRQGEK